MSGAYFVGRTQLLEWLNALCGTELTRVEQMCSGAVACQVLDALYPGKIPMARVDWTATQQHEFVHNYKLLQQAFATLKIDKRIPVDRLVCGRYQDNLEFLQWLKVFYDKREPPQQPYDAFARRAKGKGGRQYNSKLRGSSLPVLAPVKKRARASGSTLRRRNSGEAENEDYATILEKIEGLKIKSEGIAAEKEALVAQINGLRDAVERTKEERDFYSKKLQEIEELVHDAELSKATSAQTNFLGLSILDILYATMEDEQDQEQELPF